MEIETKPDLMMKDEDIMEVDNTDKEEGDPNRKVSKSPKANIKNKLLVFKFEINKRSGRSSSQEKNIKIDTQEEEEEDDIVDISNEVLISDLNKKRKRKNSNEMKIKKKRKSVDKDLEKEEAKEELKENKKSDDNVLKNDSKDKAMPVEKEEQKMNDEDKSSVDKVDTSKASVKEISKSAKVKTNSSKKSPNSRKSKSNETSAGGSKPLMTMDKFIIRKKTPEEVEKEKLAKEMEKKKIESDEIMIIENDEHKGKDINKSESSLECKKEHNEAMGTQSEMSTEKAITSSSNNNTDKSDNSSFNKDALSDKASQQVEMKQLAEEIEEKTIKDNEDMNSTNTGTEEETCLESKENETNIPEDTSNPETSKEKEIAGPGTNNIDKTDDKTLTKPRKSPRTPQRKSNDQKGKVSPTSHTVNKSNDSDDKVNKDTEEADEITSQEASQRTTPNTKQSCNSNLSKTPKTASKRTLEPKKLTPKQIEKQEEQARKREELQRKKEEKEAEKERLRLEKEQKKLEEEEKKRKEREEKEEQKRREKEEKERQRKEQEEARNRDKQFKEELRLLQIEAKNKEKAAREQERLAILEEKRKRDEAEKGKKEKAAAAFASFFKKTSGGETGGAKKTVGEGGGEENEEMMDTSGEPTKLNFMPFEIKGDMRMAPLARTQFTPERSAALDSALESSLEKEGLYLVALKRDDYVKGKCEKTWPVEGEEEPDVIILESELSDTTGPAAGDGGAGFYKYPGTSTRVRRRAKLLQFHENRRPPYFGTWSKRSQRIRARKPFKMDETIFEYDVDSDEEWEEEGEGESLRGSEDEREDEDEEGGNDYEVDNQMFVPHGYLSDEEEREDENENLDPEAHKMKLKLMELEFEEQMKRKTERLQPRLIGCVFLSNTGEYSTSNVGNHIRDLLLTRKALYVDSSLPIPIQDECIPSQSSMGGSPTTHNTEGTSGGAAGVLGKTGTPSTQGERLTSIPDSEMRDLIRLVHGSHVNRKSLGREFHTFQASNGKELPLVLIQRTIKEIAEYTLCPLTECAPNTYPKKCWFVKCEIRAKFGLADFLAYQNSWKFLVDPPSLTGAINTPTSSKKEGPAGLTPGTMNKTTCGATSGQTPVTSKRPSEETPASTSPTSRPCSSGDDVDQKGVTSGGGGDEKAVCSVPSTTVESGASASSQSTSLITKFTKILSEEERIEQLNKTKIKTSSKPKSCTELFKSQPPGSSTNETRSTNSNTTNGNQANGHTTSSGGNVKRRATLITIGKTGDTNAPGRSTSNKTDSMTSANEEQKDLDATQKGTLASRKSTTKNVEHIECVDLDNNDDDNVNIDNNKADNKGKKDTKSKMVARKNTAEKKTGELTSSVGGKTPKSALKTASGKTPRTGGKSSPQVSMMNFVTKTAAAPAKRKSEDINSEGKKDRSDDQSVRKRIKLDTKTVDEKKEGPVECIEIESSNEGW